MKKGFTLIELLVVITIIGILAVGGIGVYSEQMKKARDSTRIQHINILYSGMMEYTFDIGGLEITKVGQLTSGNLLKNYIPNISQIKDPNHLQGKCLTFTIWGSVNKNQQCKYTLYVDRSLSNIFVSFSALFESRSNICTVAEGINCRANTKGPGDHLQFFEMGQIPRNHINDKNWTDWWGLAF